MSAAAETVRGPRWLRTAVVGLAGLFYAYAVWNAVAYLVSMAQLGLSGYGWFVMIFAVVFPIIAFALAWGIGRGRAIGELALVLLAGLGVSAVFWVNVVWYTTISASSILG